LPQARLIEKEDIYKKIKTLNEQLWERRVGLTEIESWLNNFTGMSDFQKNHEKERFHSLYLLSNFIYFGARQIRELIKAMYRDLYKYPIIESIRKSNHDTTDTHLIHSLYNNELKKTRFLAVGNPSESGYYLLYFFRQENNLSKDHFIHSHQIFIRYRTRIATASTSVELQLRSKDITRYIFIDDFCGSGSQGLQYSRDIVEDIKSIDPNIIVAYFVLFATEEGLYNLKNNTKFDDIKAVYILDNSFKTFGPESRFFSQSYSNIDKFYAENMCMTYGRLLCPVFPLGYKDCQLLIGFHHNTPDNTLPIFWCDSPPPQSWKAIFKRYPKIGG
jgi:hypothetical protein